MTTPAYIRAARAVECPRCGSLAGRRCVSATGRATGEHAARYDATRKVLNIGYADGLNDALLLLDWQVRKHGVNTTVEQVREPIAGQYGYAERAANR